MHYGGLRLRYIKRKKRMNKMNKPKLIKGISDSSMEFIVNSIYSGNIPVYFITNNVSNTISKDYTFKPIRFFVGRDVDFNNCKNDTFKIRNIETVTYTCTNLLNGNDIYYFFYELSGEDLSKFIYSFSNG